MMNKIALYAIGALLLTALVIGGYYSWRAAIVKAAQADLAIRQMTQAVSDMREQIDRQERINKVANEINSRLQSQVDEIDRRNQDLEDAISGLQDRESSEVLKQTIRGLR